MKRYFLKITATGLPNNPNFAGEVNEYIYGKGEKMLMAKSNSLDFRLYDCAFVQHGYKRPSDVKRSYIYKTLGVGMEHWKEEAEIIEMEFEEK